MARFRTVSTAMWTDAKVDVLGAGAKLVLLYLLTNPLTTLCGCYEISTVRVARDTGLPSEEVEQAMEELRAVGIIDRDEVTQEVLIEHWDRYNWTSSAKLNKPLARSIQAVRCGKLRDKLISKFESSRSIPYPYGIDTVSIPFTSISSIQVTSNNAVASNRRQIVENALSQDTDAWLKNYEAEL